MKQGMQYSNGWSRWILYLSATFLVVGAIALVPQGNFLNEVEAVPGFWKAMGIMNVGFILAWLLPNQAVPAVWFWTVAVATRMAALGMYPGDDAWRYLWEGHIQLHGFSPYNWSPDAAILEPLRTGWWSMINHKDVSAIYPPLTQLGFWAISVLSSSVYLFKLGFVAADLGICALLSRRFGHGATLLYAWNPLVIYCFAGGAHYDSWFLLPLVMAWLWGERQTQQTKPTPLPRGKDIDLIRSQTSYASPFEGEVRRSRQTQKTKPTPSRLARSPLVRGTRISRLVTNSPETAEQDVHTSAQSFSLDRSRGSFMLQLNAAFWLGCSIAVKWMSLPILSFLVWQHFWSRQPLEQTSQPFSIHQLGARFKRGRWLGAFTLGVVGLLPVIITALPYCTVKSCPLVPTGSVFVSYGRSAEWIPHWIAQHWAPSLSTNSIYAIPLVMVIVWLLLRARSFGQFAEWYFIGLLLLSPIIHAWYFTWLAPFAVASRNWGTKFVTISALVYFVLPHKVALGDPSWWMIQSDRLLLWIPFCTGLALTALQAQMQICQGTITPEDSLALTKG